MIDTPPPRRLWLEDELAHADASYRTAQDALTAPALTDDARKRLEASASYYAQRAVYYRGELAKLNREIRG